MQADYGCLSPDTAGSYKESSFHPTCSFPPCKLRKPEGTCETLQRVVR